MNRIYQNVFLESGSEIFLDQPASQHLLQVLRLREGEPLILFNGQGGEYQAKLISQKKGVAQVMIEAFSAVNREANIRIHLGQCLSRGDRMDYAIQKSVEMGVYAITPIISQRCQVKVQADRMQHKLTHWQRIIISACEQSGRTQIPALHSPVDLTTWLATCRGSLNFIGDFKKVVIHPDEHILNMNLLIGPESGFTEHEMALAYAEQFHSLWLGDRILRTETAAVAGIAKLQCLWGAW